MYDCVIRTKEVRSIPSPYSVLPHQPDLCRARRFTHTSATAPLFNSIEPCGKVSPCVPFPSPLPSLTSSIALSTTLCPLPPSKITFCALPTGVSRPPTAAVAVLALHGVVTPRDWGVSGGEAVGHGVSGRSFFLLLFYWVDGCVRSWFYIVYSTIGRDLNDVRDDLDFE